MPSESLSPQETNDLLHKLITESSRVQGAFVSPVSALSSSAFLESHFFSDGDDQNLGTDKEVSEIEESGSLALVSGLGKQFQYPAQGLEICNDI